MKTETFETLQDLQGLFNTLKFVGACRPTGLELDQLAKIYKEDYGQVVNRYCPACVIDMIRVLSNQYDKALAEVPKEPEEPEKKTKKK